MKFLILIGQVLASDQVQLYSINPNNQSMLQSVDKSKLNESLHPEVRPILPKSKSNQIKGAKIDQIKGVRIFISQEITNGLNSLIQILLLLRNIILLMESIMEDCKVEIEKKMEFYLSKRSQYKKENVIILMVQSLMELEIRQSQ
ncbi:unnamed protein product [Paramecium pentaurelia]|uniref:Uncharacterized protein n=1 Tax=Paramecium pentaurelia TaxID=43138 RepID=A0A8S1VRW6_9CILI|nr:unnamed protein product [Paramecium pentaurelia]